MFFSKSKPNAHRWEHLNDTETFEHLLKESANKPFVIFKHSNRCSISSMALDKFMDSFADIAEISNLVMIDVVDNRPTSLYVAERLDVTHQSPQVIVVKNGKAIYDSSHSSIQGKIVLDMLQK